MEGLTRTKRLVRLLTAATPQLQSVHIATLCGIVNGADALIRALGQGHQKQHDLSMGIAVITASDLLSARHCRLVNPLLCLHVSFEPMPAHGGRCTKSVVPAVSFVQYVTERRSLFVLVLQLPEASCFGSCGQT